MLDEAEVEVNTSAEVLVDVEDMLARKEEVKYQPGVEDLERGERGEVAREVAEDREKREEKGGGRGGGGMTKPSSKRTTHAKSRWSCGGRGGRNSLRFSRCLHTEERREGEECKKKR